MRSFLFSLVTCAAVLTLGALGLVALHEGLNAEPAWDDPYAARRAACYLPLVLRQPTLTPTPTDTPTMTQTPTPTRYPAPTRTPTRTKTPIRTATVTPRPETVDIVCLSARPWSSYVRVQGEVVNNTGRTIYGTRLSAKFYNGSGALVGTSSSDPKYWMIPAGERSPFMILVSPAESWTRYEVAVTSYDTSTVVGYIHNLTIVQANSYWSGGNYYVVGEVRNDTNQKWYYVEAIVSFYNSSGCLIGFGWDIVDSTHLAPGQQSTFSIWEYGSYLTDLDHWTLGVEGKE